jgi:hypothetical protein
MSRQARTCPSLDIDLGLRTPPTTGACALGECRSGARCPGPGRPPRLPRRPRGRRHQYIPPPLGAYLFSSAMKRPPRDRHRAPVGTRKRPGRLLERGRRPNIVWSPLTKGERRR